MTMSECPNRESQAAASLFPPKFCFCLINRIFQKRACSLRFYLKLGSSEAVLGEGFEGRGSVCLGHLQGRGRVSLRREESTEHVMRRFASWALSLCQL